MSKTRKFFAKLKNKYRLVLINDSTFAESFSIRLTPINVLMLFSSLTLFFIVLTFLAFSYTPARHLLPNSGKPGANADWMELNQKLEDTKRQLENKQLKEDALEKILSGEEDKLDTTSTIKPDMKKLPGS
jgi:hypothetical protein